MFLIANKKFVGIFATQMNIKGTMDLFKVVNTIIINAYRSPRPALG
jgi:hypothetical protein